MVHGIDLRNDNVRSVRCPLTLTLSPGGGEGNRSAGLIHVGDRLFAIIVSGCVMPVAGFWNVGCWMESGRGLPHSKTLRARKAPVFKSWLPVRRPC